MNWLSKFHESLVRIAEPGVAAAADAVFCPFESSDFQGKQNKLADVIVKNG